jgi:hypothetical protein
LGVRADLTWQTVQCSRLFQAVARQLDVGDAMQLLGPAGRVEFALHLTQDTATAERTVDTVIADASANAEHQTDLGTHRNNSTRDAARSAEGLANTLCQTSGSAQRTQ